MLFVVPHRIERRFTLTPEAADYGGRYVELSLDRRRQYVWRTLFMVDQLRWRRGSDYAALRRIRLSVLTSLKVRLLYRLLALPGVFHAFRLVALAYLRARPYQVLEALLEVEKPDLLLHPTVLDGVFVNELVDCATRHNLPLVFAMNSWDNPSTKRSVVGKPDCLLVWGPQTRDHAIRYMGMSQERVVPFGAAQFDIYRTPPRVQRDELLRRHGIEVNRRILLYAGSSKAVDEFADLCLLDEAVEDGRLHNVAVIYRPHPWGRGGRGGARIADHPWRHVVIEQSMHDYLCKVRDGAKDLRAFPDYRDTVDVLHAVDVLVSPLSTIILEAVILGKPAICYLPGDVPGESIERQANLVHFKELFDAPEIIKVFGRGGLVDAARQALDGAEDAERSESLKRLAEYFVTSFAEPYGDRLVAFLAQRAAQLGEAHPQPS